MSSWVTRAKFVDSFTHQVRFFDAKVAAELRDPKFSADSQHGPEIPHDPLTNRFSTSKGVEHPLRADLSASPVNSDALITSHSIAHPPSDAHATGALPDSQSAASPIPSSALQPALTDNDPLLSLSGASKALSTAASADSSSPLTMRPSTSFSSPLSAETTSDPKYIITSPNMSFVPRPCAGDIAVVMRADAKFGAEDPIQWPQEAVSDVSYRWISCIPRTTHPLRQSAVWAPLTENDLLKSSRAIRTLYVVHSTRLDAVRQSLDKLEEDVVDYEKQHEDLGQRHFHSLRQLQLATESAFDRLSVPATARDLRQQFVAVERYYCMTLAWILWHDRVSQVSRLQSAIQVDDHLMGSFTTSPAVAQTYFQAGIPVWLLRLSVDIDDSFAILQLVNLTEPIADGIEIRSGEFSSTPIYRGRPGPAQISAICFRGSLYVDIEPTPFPTSYAPTEHATFDDSTAVAHPTTPVAGTSTATSSADHHARGHSHPPGVSKKRGGRKDGQSNNQPRHVDRSKFEDMQSNCIPSMLPAWKLSLKNAESAYYPPPPEGPWGYWIPDPALVVGSESQLRRTRYVLNWLRIREPWYYIARSLQHRVPLFASRWRLFLDDGFSTSSRIHASKVAQRRHLLNKLHAVFGPHNLDTSALEPVWFGRVVTDVDESICREVAWELSEVGFMIELLMLDATFYNSGKSDPQQSSYRSQLISQATPALKGFHVSSIPTVPVGLSSPKLPERGKALESLRQLMLTWPQPPPSLRAYKTLEAAEATVLSRAEREITTFYVTTFIKRAGRPPILPRHLPHVRVD